MGIGRPSVPNLRWKFEVVEQIGIKPTTSSLRTTRSIN